MNNYQMLTGGFQSHDGCWSIEHRYFVQRRELILDEAEQV